MNEAIFLILLVFSIFAWPIWLYRRMRKVQRIANARVAEKREPESNVLPYVDEERTADGTILARPMEFDEVLHAADKRAAELPDIERTLIGKR
jgi:hypothetical protein